MKKDKYFEEDIKAQTIIKHYIFKNCLKTSLNIANKNKYHEKDDRIYVYIDCYAGVGLINKIYKGSPIIACEEFKKISKQLDKLTNYKLVFFEKNNSHYQELLFNIQSSCQEIKSHIEIKNDSWTKHISNCLEKYKKDYGFIFIDPYANQDISLELLNEIIKSNYLKEILIFINLQALRRLIGKNIKNSLELANKDIEELEENVYNKFSKLGKKFVLFATLPTEKKGKIIDADYFGLIYMTNSANVADKFLIAYKEAFQNMKNSTALFGNRNIKEEIFEILNKHNSISLEKLVRILQSNYLSWKKTLKIEEIPILDKIKEDINKLLKEEKIKTSSKFLNKKTKKYQSLTKKAFNSNQNLKQTIIQINKF